MVKVHLENLNEFLKEQKLDLSILKSIKKLILNKGEGRLNIAAQI